MPHDVKGNLLKVGDEVLLRAVVEEISTGIEFCNCKIKTFYPMYPSDKHDSFSAINTRQLEKVECIPSEENKPLGWVDTKNPQFV